MNEPPRSWPSQIMRACFWLLVATICLTLSVELLKSLWPWLLGAALVTSGAVVVWRICQRDGW